MKTYYARHVMKKGWIIVLVLVLIGIISACVWYSRLETEAAAEGGTYDNTLRPRLEMSTLEISNIADEQIDMNIKMLIDNPLPVGFRANKVRYTVYIAKTPVVEELYENRIDVKSGDSTFLTLPVKLLVKKLTTVLKTLDQKNIDSTTYGIRAVFDLDVPILGERTFTQTIEKRLPTFYIPQVKIERIDVGKLSLKRTDVAAKVSIINRNKFPVNITDTHYTVTINDKLIAEGDQPESILIKAQATTPVIFPVTSKPGKTLSVLPKALFDKKNTPYLVTFRCKLMDKEGNLSFKNSILRATIKGTLDDFKK